MNNNIWKFQTFQKLWTFRQKNAKKMNKIFIVISLAICISSCKTSNSLYSKYTPIDTVSENLYGEDSSVKQLASNSNLADISWRTFFSDSILLGYIEKGITSTSDVEKAKMQIREMEINLSAAKKAFLPSLTLSPQGQITRFDGVTSKVYDVPLVAQWQADIFGSMRNKKEQAKVYAAQAQDMLQAVQCQIVSDIASIYYKLLMLDNEMEVLKATEALRIKSVETQKALMNAGMSTSAGVSRMEASLYDVQVQILDIEQAIADNELALCFVLDEDPHAIKRGKLSDFRMPEIVGTGLPVEILKNRPDVRSAQRTVEVAYYGMLQSKADLYPSLNLQATVGWTNGGGVVNPGKVLWDALAGLTAPIFAKGQLTAAYRIAQIEQDIAKEKFLDAVTMAGNEVNSALTNCSIAKRKMPILSRQVEALSSAYEATKELMNHGNITYLEVLTSQEALLNAQLNEIINKEAGIQAVISLYIALGGVNH